MLIVLFWCGSIALATGSLAHVISCRHMAPPPASLKAWEGLATQACIQLLEVCTSHPNQKKVYTAVVNKPLLLLLSQAIWPPTQQTNPHPQAKHLGNDPTGNDPAANKNADHKAEHPSGTVPTTANMAAPHGPGIQLTAVARELILSVVFHSSSIDGIIELGTSFSNSSHKPGGIAADKAAKVSAPRSYHYQLLQVGNLEPINLLSSSILRAILPLYASIGISMNDSVSYMVDTMSESDFLHPVHSFVYNLVAPL